MKLQVKDKITLHLPDVKEFKQWEKTIKEETGSKIEFEKISGEKGEFKFENKKYEFGVRK